MIKNTLFKDYRADIDGLRAVAILSVLFYHLGFNWAASGFLGVDVFFVISGYLITSHIVKDLEVGAFSIRDFYLRRMRRILPALLMVLFVCSILSYFIFTPSDIIYFAKSQLAALVSFSNIFFYKTLNYGYFATDSDVVTLLHTWSLGVEEQFYIFWPLILMAVFSSTHFKKHLFAIVLFLFSLSILIYLVSHNQKLVFFMPFTRAFELLSGAMLAIYGHRIQCKSLLLRNFLTMLGLAMILVACFAMNPSLFPSYLIIIPIIGSCLIIYANMPTNMKDFGKGIISRNYVGDILSLKIFVGIGLISYSLYLWHWPIIAFVNYLAIPITPFISTLIVIVSFVVAVMSFYFIEKPFRFKYKWGFKKTLTFLFLIPILLTVIFLLSILVTKGFPNRFSQEQLKVFSAVSSNPFEQRKGCFGDDIIPLKEDHCIVGASDVPATVLIVGDSHATSAVGFLNVLLKNADLRGYDITSSSTPYLPNQDNRLKGDIATIRNNAITEVIESKKWQFVVLGGRWDAYTDRIIQTVCKEDDGSACDYEPTYLILQEGIQTALKKIAISGARPVIILDNPKMTSDNIRCSKKEYRGLCKTYISRNNVDKEQKEMRQFLLSLKRDYPNIIYIDMMKVLCDHGDCHAIIDNIPVYFDEHHLNYVGSETLGRVYIKKYGNPFLLNF